MTEPGLSVRRSRLIDADVTTTSTSTAPRLHRSLFEPPGLGDQLLESVRDVVQGFDPVDARETLLEAGVDALDGTFADLLVDVADGDRRQFFRLLETTRRLGHGQELVDDRIAGATPPLFAIASTTPTIEVILDGDWASRPLEQRRDVLDLLADLARGCDVAIVATGTARRRLRADHRDQVPVTNGSTTSRTPDPDTIADRVDAALASLNTDAAPARIVGLLADSSTETLSYAEIARETCIDVGHVRTVAERLDADYGLAERVERPDGTSCLSLLLAGRRFAETVFGSDPVTTPPKPSHDSRVTTTQDGGEDGQNGGRPPGEAENAAAEDSDAPRGWVGVEFASRRRHEAATAAAEPGELALVDAPQQRKDDVREGEWSYDADAGQLVVSAQYQNPLQYWTTVARALASEKTWNRVLTAERLDGGDTDNTAPLAGLEMNAPDLLRDLRCLGWLADHDAHGEGYTERLRGARNALLDMTRELAREDYDDRNEFRGEIVRNAHGLAGVMVHLLDLAGVDVVREVRLSEFSRHFDSDARRDLVQTLVKGARIQSRYGQFTGERQLFEDREGKRESVPTARADPNDPFGSLLGSIVVAGDGVTDLADELRVHLEDRADVHPDAPEFAIRVPIRESSTRSSVYRAARGMLEARNLSPTREAVGLLAAFTATPYDVVDAIHHGLKTERKQIGRNVRLDEVRLALSTLPADRLLPGIANSASKGVAALLAADAPLSQAELCRRAGISTQSWRNHRDDLQLADVVRLDENGWRIALPFATDAERGDRVLPWFVDDGSTTQDVMFDVLVERVDDTARLADPDDPVGAACYWPPDYSGVLEADPSMGSLLRLIRAATHAPEPEPTSSTMGPRLSTAPIDTEQSGLDTFESSAD